jgi:hypothetical protein
LVISGKVFPVVAVLVDNPKIRPRPSLRLVADPVSNSRVSRRRHPAAVYWRRRAAAVGLGLIATVFAVIAVHAALVRIGGGPLTTTGAAGGSSLASNAVWVVHPGDTLWGIARSIDPRGDVRPLVDRLETQVGGAPLYAGERIALPASGG